MTADGSESAPGAKSASADDLADRLFERRERLAYFLITASTALIAFTVTQLSESGGPLLGASVLWLGVGWLGLLLSAGCSLMLIWRRHQAYSLYLGLLYGEPVEQRQVKRATDSVGRWGIAALVLFFVGSAVEVSGWADALIT